MAVKAPTAPTPPTPPTVPKVELSGGGSVTQSTAPPKEGTTSKSTDTEQQLEEQAREAVAQGEGGLSRTTQTDPRAEAKQAEQAAKQARQAGQDGASAARQSGEAQAQAAARTVVAPESVQAAGQQETTGQHTAQAQTAAQSFPDTLPGGHGFLYWGVSLAVIGVLAFFVLRRILSRRGRKGELTAADLADDGIDSLAGESLRGLKPDEVLARLEARERRAAPALRQQEAAGTAPIAPKAAASAQGARQIAKEYRTQALREPPRRKKPPAPVRPSVQKQEEGHFEVRV